MGSRRGKSRKAAHGGTKEHSRVAGTMTVQAQGLGFRHREAPVLTIHRMSVTVRWREGMVRQTRYELTSTPEGRI